MTLRPSRGRGYARPAEDEEVIELALPKNVAPREPIDYRDFAIPKHPPERSRTYLDFIRGELCAVNAGNNHECCGKTEAAHLETNGTSQKGSDLFTVPLCTCHHRKQHSLGLDSFQGVYGINLWQVAARHLATWIKRISR